MKEAIRAALQLFLFLALPLFLSAGSSRAEVRLPKLFSDNMVLQSGVKAPVWGWAAPGEKITVRLGAHAAEATTGQDGRWRTALGPLEAGGPFELLIEGKNKLVINNVLCGEVWLCSGQSNMAMTVKGSRDAREEIAAADYPRIRYFQVKACKAAEPREEVAPIEDARQSRLNTWEITSPETVGNYTAAGFFFARLLQQKLDVPVGIINSSWGGTTAEAWTSGKALAADPELSLILKNWPDYNNDESWLKEQYAKFIEEGEKAKQAGQPAPLYFNQPSVLYNGMIAPLIPYAIRGATWYQGESNVFRAYQYRRLFPAMIRNWRSDWGGGDLPFIFVQLANFEAHQGNWPELREAQTMTLAVPHTGMAVAIDIGDGGDIHPKNKQEVGRRLALNALALVYQKDLLYSGPLYDSMKIESGQCRISFSHTGEGLATRDNAEAGGFTVAGEDRKFYPAKARIEGKEVVVSSSEVSHPVAVRYAWTDNPEEANLYNMEGGSPALPASPFRTDDWPGMTADRK